MRRMLFPGVAVLLAMAPIAFANNHEGGQPGVVTTTDVSGHAMHITISGGIDIDSVWRDDDLVGILNREGAGTGALIVGDRRSQDDSDSDSFFSPRVWLRFDAYMSDHVSAVIELNNERLDSGLHSHRTEGVGTAASTLLAADGEPGWGAEANVDVFGGGYGDNRDIFLAIQQAYLQVDDFLVDRFSVRFGIQDFVVDLRGNGNPFLIAFRPEGAEKAFISPVTESFSSEGSNYAYRAIFGADTLGVYRGEEEAAGLRFTYSADEHLHFDVWTFNLWETGFQHYDEWFYGVMAKYNVPDSPSVGQLLWSCTSNDSDKNRVYTIGPGVDYWWDNLEVYGEFYYQWGEYADEGALRPAGGGDPNGDVDQEAFAFYLGARYNFDDSCSPWVDVHYAYIDGDQGERNDDDDDNQDFVSYEDNDSLMILEDNLYGLDVDSNYWKAQFNGGVILSLQHEKDLTVSLTYAYAELVTTPDRVDHTSDFTDGLSLAEPLGHEVDVKFVWQYSDSLSFDLVWAGLFDGQFWSSGTNADFAIDPDNAGGPDGDATKRIDDNMYLITVGATVRF